MDVKESTKFWEAEKYFQDTPTKCDFCGKSYKTYYSISDEDCRSDLCGRCLVKMHKSYLECSNRNGTWCG